MERCKGDFYVSLVRNLRFSRPSCTFSAWETYGSASGNVECGSRFVSLCRWILLFLCGDVSGGKLKNIKTKKHRQSSDYQCFLPVGVTGFEPATTRPPDAYSNRAELHPELRMQRYGFFWYLQIFSVLFYIKSASFYARY